MEHKRPDLIIFTKSFRETPNEQIGRTVKDLGFDGLDVTIRPGYAVNPENVARELPRAVKLWAEMGLKVELATTAGDFLDPAGPTVAPIYAACGEVGVPAIKLGYWTWNGGYWETIERLRRALEGFAKLSEKYGPVTTVHTHSGNCYGSNCAGLMHLLKGLDPRYVGAYVDPGHMSLDGEHYEMGFDMVRPYLRLVALKSPRWAPRPGAEPAWKVEWVPMREGIVPWRRVLNALFDIGYAGPLNFHSEYDRPLEEVLRITRDDLALIVPMVEEIWGTSAAPAG
jgi:sugar phosphate isomerase/epimerase